MAHRELNKFLHRPLRAARVFRCCFCRGRDLRDPHGTWKTKETQWIINYFAVLRNNKKTLQTSNSNSNASISPMPQEHGLRRSAWDWELHHDTTRPRTPIVSSSAFAARKDWLQQQQQQNPRREALFCTCATATDRRTDRTRVGAGSTAPSGMLHHHHHNNNGGGCDRARMRGV